MYCPKTPLKTLVKDGFQKKGKCSKRKVCFSCPSKKMVNVGKWEENPIEDKNNFSFVG